MIESRYKQSLLGFILFVLLIAISLLTYRGFPMSGDELFLFDSAESFANRGNLLRTYQFDQVSDLQYSLVLGEDGEPWLPAVQEPLAPILISPLILFAQSVPHIGTMHIIWLFNVIIIALTGVSLYVIALSWKYKIAPSWLLALTFGIATNSSFYGRLLFREPLMAFFTLWVFALAVDVGVNVRVGNFPFKRIVFLLIAFLGAIFTKAIAVFLLPMIIIAVFPTMAVFRNNIRNLIVVSLGAIVLIVIVVLVSNTGILGTRYSLSTVLNLVDNIQWSFVVESVLGFQFSLGRSFWLYSPPLLIGIWGVKQLLRNGQWRVVLAPITTLLLFSAWYGVALTLDWLGGWGWGPRYLVPLIPIFMLWSLPIFVEFKTLPKRVAVASVVLFGIGMQFLGMAVPLSNYYTDLFFNDKIYDFSLIYIDRAGVEAEWAWMDAVWGWEWSPINYHLSRLDFSQLDIAWRFADGGAVAPILFTGLIALCLAIGWWLWRRPVTTIRFGGVVSIVLIVCLGVSISVGLSAMSNDSRYIGEWGDIRQLVDSIDSQVDDNDAVLIESYLYTPIFMNYFKSDSLVITLPFAPGEAYDESGPQVISDDPIQQIGSESVYAIEWVADHYEHIWLITDASPFNPIRLRPIERFLVDQYFPVQTVDASDSARAIQFLSAESAISDSGVTITDEYQFDDQFILADTTLPLGTTFSAGDVIPLSLSWQVQQTLNVDYNIGVYLFSDSGALVAQQDGLPQSTFGYTSRWVLDSSYRDNHGLQLTDDIPSGEYQLFVAIYNWQTLERLTVYDGVSILGDSLLLGTIVIEN